MNRFAKWQLQIRRSGKCKEEWFDWLDKAVQRFDELARGLPNGSRVVLLTPGHVEICDRAAGKGQSGRKGGVP